MHHMGDLQLHLFVVRHPGPELIGNLPAELWAIQVGLPVAPEAQRDQAQAPVDPGGALRELGLETYRTNKGALIATLAGRTDDAPRARRWPQAAGLAWAGTRLRVRRGVVGSKHPATACLATVSSRAAPVQRAGRRLVMPRVTGLGHVGLFVHDPATMIEFSLALAPRVNRGTRQTIRASRTRRGRPDRRSGSSPSATTGRGTATSTPWGGSLRRPTRTCSSRPATTPTWWPRRPCSTAPSSGRCTACWARRPAHLQWLPQPRHESPP